MYKVLVLFSFFVISCFDFSPIQSPVVIEDIADTSAYLGIVSVNDSILYGSKDQVLSSYKTGASGIENGYQTENVIIVVMDGARYSETFGQSEHAYIPKLSNEMMPYGVLNDSFYNDGVTLTFSAHASLTTGVYQTLRNNGKDTPEYPNMFQYYTMNNHTKPTDTYIIAAKDKLEALAFSTDTVFNQYSPETDCGVNGIKTGYRTDVVTIDSVLIKLQRDQPKLTLINFSEPDVSGHGGDWEHYISGIQSSDENIHKIWEFINENSNYSGKTTLFVTNDHGRHLDEVGNGFVSHGCNCDGCRHVFLYAYGPDFKKDVTVSDRRGLIDITETSAELLGFDMPTSMGNVMTELFK